MSPTEKSRRANFTYSKKDSGIIKLTPNKKNPETPGYNTKRDIESALEDPNQLTEIISLIRNYEKEVGDDSTKAKPFLFKIKDHGFKKV